MLSVVEVTGFEPAAPTSRTWCSTKLSHTSNYFTFDIITYFLSFCNSYFFEIVIFLFFDIIALIW